MSEYEAGRQASSARAIIYAVLLGSLCALAVTGCASSPQFPSVKQSGAPKAVTASWSNWDECLRQHGVSVPAGYDPYDPHGVTKPRAGAAVIHECQRYEPPAPPPTTAFGQRLAATSKCMTAHGFPNTYALLPDDGYEINYGPGVNPPAPGFTAAHKQCGSLA